MRMGKYLCEYAPEHPRSTEGGCVYTHVLVAEKKLGRFLLKDEVVHHKDHDKFNNNPDNLIVFATNADHARFHTFQCNEDYLIQNENGSFSCKEKKTVCVDCGKEIWNSATRCVECSHKHQRRVERPSKEQLYNDITACSGNFTALARKYGVTDNAIRKWCVFYELPKHSKDYKE